MNENKTNINFFKNIDNTGFLMLRFLHILKLIHLKYK